MKPKKVLITGCAGFVGSSLAQKLLEEGYEIVGIDNYNTAYNPQFKRQNIARLIKYPNFTFYKGSILEPLRLETLFKKHMPSCVVHLAALTGIRSSLNKSGIYRSVNITGTKNVYQKAAKYHVSLFIFASSSSIYGNNNPIPFKENYLPHPESPYAKTKLKTEEMLQKFSKQQIPTTILRLFSVYGPYGRPDMAPYLFTQAAYTQKAITLFGDGSSARDYTYIDDVVRAFQAVIDKNVKNKIINIGSQHPIQIKELIKIIEKKTGKKIKIKQQPLIREEALVTFADCQKAKKILNWKPQVNFTSGMNKFIQWYNDTRLHETS